MKDFFQFRESLVERTIKVGPKLIVNFDKGRYQGDTSLTFEWGAPNGNYDGWKNNR